MAKTDYKKIEKVIVSVGVGRLSQQPNFTDRVLPEIEKEIATISGQKAKTTTAKKSIAGFKSRQGQIVGLQVTLRGKRAEDFMERLIHTAIPRVKDFRGIDLNNIDRGGNLNFGVREQVIFPEIIAEQSKVNFGLQITIVPRTLKSRNEAIALYRSIGVPLKK